MKKLLVGLCTVGLLASSLVHAVEHDWTNKQGKAIKAGFVSAGEEAVTISMGGKSYVVKLADLSPQSRALAAKLRVQKSKAREPQNDKTPLVKTSEVAKIDLDDKETRNRIAAEAISYLKIQPRMENGEEVYYAENQETPYSGWMKVRNLVLMKFNRGKQDGLKITWRNNGQKDSEQIWKDGKVMTFATWKPNGEKCPVTKVVNGNGVMVAYRDDGTERRRVIYKDSEQAAEESIYRYDNGQKMTRRTYKDGKLLTLVVWKPNGEKCPVTNVVDGNGVAVFYNDDGTEDYRWTYKDGLWTEWDEDDEDGKLLGQEQEVDATKPEVEGPKVVVDWEQIEERDDLGYFEGKPFTRVAVYGKYKNGHKKFKRTFKDGKGHGLRTAWYETGQKHWETTYKDGNLVTATAWKPNGEKCPDTNLVDGNGIVCSYHKNGQKNKERTYKDGEEISTKEWDEDGNPK